MYQSRFLEALTTKYLVFTIVLIVIITVGSFAAILTYGLTDISTIATFVDAVFKTVALFIGLCALLPQLLFAERASCDKQAEQCVGLTGLTVRVFLVS